MIVAWMSLVVVLAGSASSSSHGLRSIDRRVVASSASVALAGPPFAARAVPADASVPPPCLGDVCQPRVAVPGYEPRLSTRGKRTELAAHLLDRANLEPLASISHFLVVTGLRLDVTPAALDRSTLTNGSAGRGHVQLMLRWRIDAFGKPVWAVVR
ncbi:MAG TPA: hypothetical protein VLC54_03250 [Anaeromyxobacter sp.]|nr:hypothetical protein [Anaeromyxobacter sp.]